MSTKDVKTGAVRKPLRRATASVWLSGAAILGVLWGQYWFAILPPRVVPFAVLLSLMCGSILLAFFAGAWRLIAGPSRANALMWCILALLPPLLLAAPCEYARRQWKQKRVPANFVMRTATLLAASAMRAQALYKYPNRIETPHLIMLYDRLDRPRADAEAMEKHVARLEALLGRRLPSKIVWVRGSLLGEDSVSFHGLALGSERSPEDWNAVGEHTINHHELAHAALDLLRSPRADPPMFLHEGWAELYAWPEPEVQLAALAREAFQGRNSGQWISLRELAGPAWYHTDSGPVYWEGHLFVEFVVRRYGIDHFFELYDTCRPTTFESDCQRILGASLDDLEAELWEDLSKRLANAEPRRWRS